MEKTRRYISILIIVRLKLGNLVVVSPEKTLVCSTRVFLERHVKHNRKVGAVARRARGDDFFVYIASV
jgi:hypothetical protein